VGDEKIHFLLLNQFWARTETNAFYKVDVLTSNGVMNVLKTAPRTNNALYLSVYLRKISFY
jgi:hypothetical protein